MKNRIYKYPFPDGSLYLPVACRFHRLEPVLFDRDPASDNMCLWFEVGDDDPYLIQEFRIAATGEDYDTDHWELLVSRRFGAYVFHLLRKK